MNRKKRKEQKKKQRQERIRHQKHHRHFGDAPAVVDGADIPEWDGVSSLDEEDPADVDEQFQRIDAILGDSMKRGLGSAVKVYCEYLRNNLVLPCEVTGIEDFRWEEFYVIGPGSKAEHARLRKVQPSHIDHYQLIGIEPDEFSEWMLFAGDDIAAHVKRISDNKEFVLGLAELEAVDQHSPNFQLLHDYSVFLVNYR